MNPIKNFEQLYGIELFIESENQEIKITDVSVRLSPNKEVLELELNWDAENKYKYAKFDSIEFDQGLKLNFQFEDSTFISVGFDDSEENSNKHDDWNYVGYVNTKYGLEITFISTKIKFEEVYQDLAEAQN